MLTKSTMLALGTRMPDFELPRVKGGELFSSEEYENKKAVLVMFICRHCPYVQHVAEELARLGEDYKGKDLGIVAISANDAENYPEDAPDSLADMAEEYGFEFPFCYDETQEVARDFTAACTPDFFLFDEDKKLVYRGQLDDARPGNNHLVTGKDLRAAIDAVLAGKPVPRDQKPSSGCSIKWKAGNEPTYL